MRPHVLPQPPGLGSSSLVNASQGLPMPAKCCSSPPYPPSITHRMKVRRAGHKPGEGRFWVGEESGRKVLQLYLQLGTGMGPLRCPACSVRMANLARLGQTAVKYRQPPVPNCEHHYCRTVARMPKQWLQVKLGCVGPLREGWRRACVGGLAPRRADVLTF